MLCSYKEEYNYNYKNINYSFDPMPVKNNIYYTPQLTGTFTSVLIIQVSLIKQVRGL